MTITWLDPTANHRLPALALLGAGLLLGSPAAGAETTTADQDPAGPSLTVYSTADPAGFDPKQFLLQNNGNVDPWRVLSIPGFGVVRDTRRIEVPKGISDIRFTDVASQIDPTTVGFIDRTSKGTRVLEQNFEFDLVSPQKLLKKYIDREVTLRWDATNQEVTGTLLSSMGGQAVLKNKTGIQIVSTDDARISMGQLPGGLITRPTLVWKLDAPKGGMHEIETSYQTAGLTWRADYNLTLDANSNTANMTAWVTLMNLSGASYENARLKLVAGEVQKIQPKYGRSGGMRAMEMADVPPTAAGFKEESFFEYHLYTLPRRTDVKMNGTQQLILFPPVRGFKIKKELLYQGAPGMMNGGWGNQPVTNNGYGVSSSKDVEVFIEVENKKDNGLGIPMPAGRMRLYMANPNDGSLEFIGEDTVDHTPRNETIRVKAGNAFDVVGERTQVDFKVDTKAKTMAETWSIEIRNQKDVAQTVVVREPLYRWRNWKIETSDPFEKINARVVQWTVDVPAEGKKTINYVVRYSW